MREDVELYGGNVRLTFDPDKHRYTASTLVDGAWSKPLWTPSVTGITGMLDDGKSGALMGWSNKLMAAEIIEKIFALAKKEGWGALDEVTVPKIVNGAKSASRRAVQSAGTLGTVVHDYCEHHVKQQLGLCDAPTRPRNVKAQSGIDGFLKWESENEVEYLYSERKIYSVLHHYAGTLDLLARVNGELTIVDLKTSSRVYDEHKLQTAGYWQALSEEFEEAPANRMILHLSKEGGVFTIHDLNREAKYNDITLEDDLAAFIGLRAAYRRVKEKTR